MKKLLLALTVFLVQIVLIQALFLSPVFAEACDTSNLSSLNLDELSRRKEKCEEAFSQMEAAKKPHVDSLRKMESDIAAFQARISQIEAELIRKTTAIKSGEKELEELLSVATRRIRQFYIRSYQADLANVAIFTSSDLGQAMRVIGYQRTVTNEDKKVITQTALMVKDLMERKRKLEQEKINLSSLKESIDARAVSIRKLVAEADAYQTKLSGMIAAISAQQQSFLAQKLAGLGIPLYAMSGGGCSSDLTNGKDPGFTGGFGFFTFGVPNRVGLNQFGAYGRAKNNQTYDQILRAYYTFDEYKDVDVDGITIRVNDSNSVNKGNIIWTGSLHEYLKRIYEVPGDWPVESLKAQIIAIRSYVLASTDNGNLSICANQYCQVFKSEAKGGAWEQTVNSDDVKKKIMVQGGKPIKAFFSSTHGGYSYNTGDLQGWSQTSYTKRMIDTPSGSVSSFEELKNSAYDKDSPWFYCDWGGRSQYGGTAWLKPDEVADIVNTYLLAQQDGSTQKHLTQVDKPNPDGVETWNADTVRSKLGSSAYSTIENISVNADFGSGRTTQVTISGNGKTTVISGDVFKTYFNLRAPSNIQIVGPLFNIEKK